MARLDLNVVSDLDQVVPLLLETYESTFNFDAPKSKPVAKFIQDHPSYKSVPRSFIEGCLKRGRPVSSSTRGFRVLPGNILRVWGMGKVKFEGNYDSILRPLRFEFAEGKIIVHTPGFKRRRGKKFASYDSFQNEKIFEMRQEDDIVDYLLVNGIPPGEDFWRKHAILHYARENPTITREDIRSFGFTSDKDMQLLADFLPGMQEWVRATSKPPECNFLSEKYNGQGQYYRKKKRELAMPDAIKDADVDRKSLKSQSFNAQIYDALHRNADPLM